MVERAALSLRRTDVQILLAGLLLLALGPLVGCSKQRPPRSGNSAAARPATRQIYLWKIRHPSGRHHAWLAGSIHMNIGARPTIDRALLDAFSRAEGLALEVDLLDPKLSAEGYQLAARLGRYGDGDGLSQHASAETVARVKRELAALELSSAMAERMRPWLLTLTITVARLQRAGYRQDSGLDAYFAAHAVAKKLPVASLETAKTQIEALASGGDDLHIEALEALLGAKDRLIAEMKALGAAYLRGDDRALVRMTIQARGSSPAARKYQQRIFTERNRTMAASLIRLLKTRPRRWFAMVGAAHLVGPDSIIERLRSAGMTLERVAPRALVKAPAVPRPPRLEPPSEGTCRAELPGRASFDSARRAAEQRGQPFRTAAERGGIRYAFFSSPLEISPAQLRTPGTIQALYQAFIQSIADRAGLHVASNASDRVSRAPAQRFSLVGRGSIGQGRVVVVGTRICCVLAVGTPQLLATQRAEVTAVLDTLALVTSSAGQPPGSPASAPSTRPASPDGGR